MGNTATTLVNNVPDVQGPLKARAGKEVIDDATTVASSTVGSLPVSEIQADENASVSSSISQDVAQVSSTHKAVGGKNSKCTQWCGTKFYSDLIQEGLRYVGKSDENVIMLFESPSTASKDTSFYNSQVFPIHDYPPSDPCNKTVLAPIRYSMMNGNTYPSYLKDAPPAELLKHWDQVIPNIPKPVFVQHIADNAKVFAYLPLEDIPEHVNDPHIHYHLAGKDALHLMTPNTPRLLANTKDYRPCIAKVTHSMASKGIFVINTDDDEKELFDFLESSGNPNYVVTDFVDIARNVSCHFFIHPNGEVVWFGSSENYKNEEGRWSMDAIVLMDEQEELKDLQYPYAREVADYCLSLGFWGFCGVDVLVDQEGKGHIVDVNPRTTGTCPALMVANLFQKQYGYTAGLFRRSAKCPFPGSAEELVRQVEEYNSRGEGRIVLASLYESSPTVTMINIGVYTNSLEESRLVLNRFAQPPPNC